MTTITLNTTAHQDNLIAQYLKEHNTDLDDLVTKILLEKLEDEADLKALRKTQAEDDGYRISFEDIMKKYAHEL
ncbi:DUF6290 family protein [Streptococcus porci]|uniref:DUF6290 family protein n=1 Tax=Streptococcus porci TaxID=502567 RepID=UPI0003F97145|nr:DUF6290 family protein [Streptococcus porci]